jgi:hypothetical protein
MPSAVPASSLRPSSWRANRPPATALPAGRRCAQRPVTFRYQAARTAPGGLSPWATSRPKAPRSFRARAPLPSCRSRARPWPQRSWDPRLRWLAGCQESQPQARSTLSQRRRVLPAFLMPGSRGDGPECYGGGGNPASAASARRCRIARHPQPSRPKSQADCAPIPRPLRSVRTGAPCCWSSRTLSRPPAPGPGPLSTAVSRRGQIAPAWAAVSAQPAGRSSTGGPAGAPRYGRPPPPRAGARVPAATDAASSPRVPLQTHKAPQRRSRRRTGAWLGQSVPIPLAGPGRGPSPAAAPAPARRCTPPSSGPSRGLTPGTTPALP